MRKAASALRASQGRLLASALTSAGAAALAIGFILSPPVFRTSAVVSVTDALERLQAEATHAAADLAVSRPVLLSAAVSLIDAKAAAPQPGLFDRFVPLGGLTRNVDAEAARFADQMQQAVHAVPRLGSVTLDVTADDADPRRASVIATATANALVSYRDTVIADLHRMREGAQASRLARIRAAASAAHQHLTMLAGADADSSPARAAAQEQVEAAQARAASLRAIVGSGTPPLADGRNVPPSVEALQSSYLDLTRKLALASETLGDRHTTIIALRDGASRAAASLTAEWKRLLRLADSDLAAAKERVAALDKGNAQPPQANEAAIEDARRAARIADEMVMRAEAAADTTDGEQSYRLLAPAPVPLAPVAGWSTFARVAWGLVIGSAAFGLVYATRSRRLPSGAIRTEPDAIVGSDRLDPGKDARSATDPSIGEPMLNEPARRSFFDPQPVDAPVLDLPPLAANPSGGVPSSIASLAGPAPDAVLEDALGDVIANLLMAEPEAAGAPTIMVAANEVASRTLDVALMIAGVAVHRGMRVLVVEGPRARPELAATARADCEPVLAEVFASLRVLLPADGFDSLFVAPFFRNGAQIASALVRSEQAPLIHDLGGEFDLIVIDGCRAADSVEAGLSADAYLRVGRFASRRETERFLRSLDIPAEALVGTITDTTFLPPESPPVERPAMRRPLDPEPSGVRAAQGAEPRRAASQPLRQPYPRRVATR